MPTDVEIASQYLPQPIGKIADQLGIAKEDLLVPVVTEGPEGSELDDQP